MNIVIFAPGLKASAIGRMTGLLVRELSAQGHTVVLIRSEEKVLLSAVPQSFSVEVIDWLQTSAVDAACAQADAIVHQIGDNYHYHYGSLEWLSKYPSVVCLHDFYLGNLFFQWAQTHMAEAEQALLHWYGAGSNKKFFEYSHRQDFIELTCAAMPMTEWLCAMASAVITHSSWGIKRVLDSCAGPVRAVPLAYEVPAWDGESAVSNAEAHADGEPFNILTIGNVNANKRAASVIRALAQSEKLRRSAVFRLVGQCDTLKALELSALARNLGVNLVISGPVDDDVLAVIVRGADVVSCLRWPSLEAASASAIEAMLHCKPVVVTNVGFYREIPSDHVVHIDPDNEIDSLCKALEWLHAEPEARLALGRRAQAWASQQFTAAGYCRALLGVVDDMHMAAPILHSMRFFAQALSDWKTDTRWLGTSLALDPIRSLLGTTA
ncbi:MAG TPA: glycosyltransferase family 4 protein [Dyella sp.]|uniref:glycosyltransferase family 4 protein n=1 Tax=Dyella sp. TaxID=1869338 RepID=UPI002F93DF56